MFFIGIVFIVLQIISIIGNINTGGLNFFSDVTNFESFTFALLNFLGYFFIGILGLICILVSILKRYRKPKKGNTNNNTTLDESDDSEKNCVENDINESIPVNEDTPPPTNDNLTKEVPIAEVATTLNEEKVTIHKKTSNSFCRNCGSKIDATTKKCTGCGKQYFKGLKYYLSVLFTKKRLPIILSVMLFISVICNIGQAVSTNDRIDSLICELNNAYNSEDFYEDLYREANSKLYFYEKYIVLVSNDGTNIYHKYGCEDFGDSIFWAYNVELAKVKGYVPHKKCCN